MGITNFNKWIEQNYPQIIKTINYKEYDNVYIDLNPILHVSVNKANNLNQLYKRIIWLTDEVLKHIHPKKRLIFSTDGIPSFAKMILQRERRINMVKNLEIKNTENFISPIIFTPGTKFMNNLPNFIKDYFDKLQDKYKDIELIDLTGLEYGESEFKLFNKMKDIIKLNNKESNILVSNDADVIIMALSITNNSEIYIGNSGKIYREISLNGFLNKLNLNKYNNSNLDYTLLLLLLGNDYLPKLNFININNLLGVYHKIKNVYKVDLVTKNNNRLVINNNILAKIIFTFFLNNKKFKSKKLQELNFNKMKNYMEGLTWCINDYNKAKNDNMFYMYNYKKNGIDPAELYYYLKLKNKEIINYPVPKIKAIVNRKIYPAIVMPYKIKFLVKNEYPDKIINKFKEYYAEELCETCNNYHKQLSNLCCSRKFLEDTCDESSNNLDKITTIRSNISKNTKELGIHKKKSHKRLSYDKYIEIIDYLNNS
jgi:hypothetical protein